VDPNPANPARPPGTSAGCPACRREVGEGDHYCRHCGRRLSRGTKWYYEPVWVWVLGLFVLGALALPLAWWSPKMSALNKLAFTVLVTALTALLFFLCYLVFGYVWDSYETLREAGPVLWP